MASHRTGSAALWEMTETLLGGQLAGELPSLFQRPSGWGCLVEEASAALSRARCQGGVSRDLWVDNKKGR